MIRIILLLTGIGTLSSAEYLSCSGSGHYSYGGYSSNSNCTIRDVVITDVSSSVTFSDSGRYYMQYFKFVNSRLIEIPKKIFESFSAVRILDVSDSGIESVNRYTFERATSLTMLNVSFNNLVELKNYVFSGATELAILDLSNNNISDIEEKAFQNLASLQTLFLSGNKLKSLRDDVFHPLGSLARLSLARNDLEVIQKGLFDKNVHLKVIFINNNQLVTIDKNLFDELHGIEYLWLRNNNLTSFDFNNLEAMRVNVINNQLKTIKLSSKIQYLYASNNSIAEITADSFESLPLHTLSLAWNNLTSMDGIDEISSLEVLDLSHNKIGALKLTSFAKLTKLVDLTLEDTRITNLQHGTFSQLSLLKRLDISYNNLNRIDLDIFTSSHQMEELFIEGNRLKEINYEEIPKSFPSLNKISIADNNWNCSYLTRMIRTLNSNSVVVGGFKSENLIADKTNVKGIYCADTKNPLTSWNETAKHFDKYLNDSVPIIDTSEIKQIMQNAVDDISNFNKEKLLFINKTDQMEGEMSDLTKRLMSLENEILEVKKSILDMKMTQLANATNETFVSTDLKKMMQEQNDLTLTKLNLTAESLAFKIYQQSFKIDKFIEKINENAEKLLILSKQVAQGSTILNHNTIQQEQLRATASSSGSGSSNAIMAMILVVLVALLVIVLVVIYRNRLTAFGARRGTHYGTSNTLATMVENDM